MKFSRPLFVLTLLLIIVLGVFALPVFSFSVAGRTVTWPALDMGVFGLNNLVGNFQRGDGIYASHRISFTADMGATPAASQDEVFAQDVALIRKRLDAAGVSDVQFATLKQGKNYKLWFTFPNYYTTTELQTMASLLVQPGNIEIWESDSTGAAAEDKLLSQFYPGYRKIISDIRLSDIATVGVETRTVLEGPVWRIHFQDPTKDKLATTLSRAGYTTQTAKPLVIAVDGTPVMIMVNIGQPLDMLGRPFSTAINAPDLKILSTYLIGSTGVRAIYNTDPPTDVPAIYASEGRIALAVTFIVSALLVAVVAVRRFGRGALSFGLMSGIYLLLNVAVMKLTAIPISIGVLIGFTFSYVLGVLAVYMLMSTPETAVQRSLNRIRNLGVVLFAMSSLLYISGLGFEVYQGLLSTLVIGSLALTVCCGVLFRQLLAFYYSTQHGH